MTQPRITTSEPAYRAPMSQWQKERASGPIAAKEPATLHVGSGEVLGIAWLFLVIVPVVVGLWWLV